MPCLLQNYSPAEEPAALHGSKPKLLRIGGAGCSFDQNNIHNSTELLRLVRFQ